MTNRNRSQILDKKPGVDRNSLFLLPTQVGIEFKHLRSTHPTFSVCGLIPAFWSSTKIWLIRRLLVEKAERIKNGFVVHRKKNCRLRRSVSLVVPLPLRDR